HGGVTEIDNASDTRTPPKGEDVTVGSEPLDCRGVKPLLAGLERLAIQLERRAFDSVLALHREFPPVVGLGKPWSVASEPERWPVGRPGQRHSTTVASLLGMARPL